MRASSEREGGGGVGRGMGRGDANRQQKLPEQLNLVAETCASGPRLLQHAVIGAIAVLSFQTMSHMHMGVHHCIAWMRA